jgi:hypothetical protein
MIVFRRTLHQVRQQIGGYINLAKQYLDQGWQGHLMTVMFNQLPGNVRSKNDLMRIGMEGLYSSFLTRVVRRPRQSLERRPKLIACPDWPVAKHSKIQLDEIMTNDGCHYHGILLTPPVSRLILPAPLHFEQNQRLYLRDPTLRRIDVRTFDPGDVHDVVDYALKALKADRLPDDEDLLILPKSTFENTIRRPYLSKG